MREGTLILIYALLIGTALCSYRPSSSRWRRQYYQQQHNQNANNFPFPYPYPQYVPNTYPLYYPGQPQQASYQISVNNGRNPPSGGNLNINIPSGSPSQSSMPGNVNNVIYGPQPPSNINNNFFAPAPQPSSNNKYCDPNTQFDCHNGKCLDDPLQLCDGRNDCGNRSDENNCDHLKFKVKLKHGETSNEGVLEVSVKGQKGCVCNRNFDVFDGDVVCRELGFEQGCDRINRVSIATASEIYPDDIPYLMDDLNCHGNETSLRKCEFAGWGRIHRSCGMRNIVSVSCKREQPSSHRSGISPSNDGSPGSGNNILERDEFSPENQHRNPTKTADSGFQSRINLTRDNDSVNFHTSFSSNTTIATDNRPARSCEGNQFMCKSSKRCIPINRICDRYSDCDDASDENGEGCNQPVQIRLANGRAVNEGRLEIRVHGIWGSICGKSFGHSEASVVCRALGFLGQPQIAGSSTFGEGIGPIWLDNLSCPFDDTCCLTSCNNLNWGTLGGDCNHSMDVGVICSNLLRY